uniref:Uncharacterized protein n=1 Tax=Cucumis melo TaxID=3656 RepID=A0A9I9EBJ6_CUCME
MNKVNNNNNYGTPAKDSGKVTGKENRKTKKNPPQKRKTKQKNKTKMERGDKEEKKGFGFA